MKTLNMKTFATAALATAMATGVFANNKISEGTNHTLYIDRDGNAYAMGNCSTGVCGVNSLDPKTMQPTYVGLQNVKEVEAGIRRSAFVTKDNKISATVINTGELVEYTGVEGMEVLEVEFYIDTLYALVKTGEYTVDGKIYPKGQIYKADSLNILRPVNNNTDYISLDIHAVAGGALDMFGNVYTWGPYTHMLGDGSTSGRKELPAEPTITGYGFRHLDMGYKSAVAVTMDDTLFYWGKGNTNPYVGMEVIPPSDTPVQFAGSIGIDDVAVAYTGHSDFWVIKKDGTLWGAGFHNYYMRLLNQKVNNWVTFQDNNGGEIRASMFSEGLGDQVLIRDQYGKLYGHSGNSAGKLGIDIYEVSVELHQFMEPQAPNYVPPKPVEQVAKSAPAGDKDRGHGNDADGIDEDNPAYQKFAELGKARQLALLEKARANALARKNKK